MVMWIRDRLELRRVRRLARYAQQWETYCRGNGWTIVGRYRGRRVCTACGGAVPGSEHPVVRHAGL